MRLDVIGRPCAGAKPLRTAGAKHSHRISRRPDIIKLPINLHCRPSQRREHTDIGPGEQNKTMQRDALSQSASQSVRSLLFAYPSSWPPFRANWYAARPKLLGQKSIGPMQLEPRANQISQIFDRGHSKNHSLQPVASHLHAFGPVTSSECVQLDILNMRGYLQSVT